MKKIRSTVIALAMGVLAGCTEADKFDYDKNVIFVSGAEVTPVTKFVLEDTPSSFVVTASTAMVVDKDIKVKFAIDNSLVEAYNEKNSTSFSAVPDDAIVFENGDAVVVAGKSFSTPATVKVVSTENFVEGRNYLIPVTIQTVDGLEVLEPSRTLYLQISRVIHFASLNISNPNMYSNFKFPEDKQIELSNYTYEIKFRSEEWHHIARMFAFPSAMLRFGELGAPVNSVQWCYDGGNMYSNTLFDTNRWYMLSLTNDGSNLTMYVDGVKDNQMGGAKPVKLESLEFGMSWTGYPHQQYFKGRIAEVRVWNRALSPGELKLGLCGVDPQSEGLIAYWKMNEGEGHIFHDATGNGYDIDWSNTFREIQEGNPTYGLDYSQYVGWDKDDNNKCAQ